MPVLWGNIVPILFIFQALVSTTRLTGFKSALMLFFGNLEQSTLSQAFSHPIEISSLTYITPTPPSLLLQYSVTKIQAADVLFTFLFASRQSWEDLYILETEIFLALPALQIGSRPLWAWDIA